MAHDLVDLAVLLSAHKLLVFVCQFDLDSHLILRASHEGNVVNDHQSGFDRIVGAVDCKTELFKRYIGARVGTNVRENASNFGRGREARDSLRRVGLNDPPRSTVELASLIILAAFTTVLYPRAP